MTLVLAVLLLPIVEIALFILVGEAIGLWPTLLLVVAGAVAGVMVLRARALLTLPQLRAALTAGGDPMAPITHGALVMLAGVLLVVPGFLTDAAALLLLIPGVRRWMLRRLSSRVSVAVAGRGSAARPRAGNPSGTAIEADYEVVEDGYEAVEDAGRPATTRQGGSGWTRRDG